MNIFGLIFDRTDGRTDGHTDVTNGRTSDFLDSLHNSPFGATTALDTLDLHCLRFRRMTFTYSYFIYLNPDFSTQSGYRLFGRLHVASRADLLAALLLGCLRYSKILLIKST